MGKNAHWDNTGEYFVAEGDESDGTVALFQPEHTIILNIEEEHLDYYADLRAIEAVFNRLMERTTGKVFYCIDDPHAQRLCQGRPNTVSFGASCRADYRFENPAASEFPVHVRGLPARREARHGGLDRAWPAQHQQRNQCHRARVRIGRRFFRDRRCPGNLPGSAAALRVQTPQRRADRRR